MLFVKIVNNKYFLKEYRLHNQYQYLLKNSIGNKYSLSISDKESVDINNKYFYTNVLAFCSLHKFNPILAQ